MTIQRGGYAAPLWLRYRIGGGRKGVIQSLSKKGGRLQKMAFSCRSEWKSSHRYAKFCQWIKEFPILGASMTCSACFSRRLVVRAPSHLHRESSIGRSEAFTSSSKTARLAAIRAKAHVLYALAHTLSIMAQARPYGGACADIGEVQAPAAAIIAARSSVSSSALP